MCSGRNRTQKMDFEGRKKYFMFSGRNYIILEKNGLGRQGKYPNFARRKPMNFGRADAGFGGDT